MTDFKLSIIIPTFNLENIIEKTFNSVKSQTIGFENIELIFVDDNSTDNTFNLIKGYENKYENVKVFKTDENSGFAGKPRNIGIEQSTSDYILFLDGDDQLLINACEILYNKINSTNSDIVVGAHINLYKDTHQEHNSPLFSGIDETFTDMRDANLLNIVPALCAKLFKRNLLINKNITFHEGIPGQDLVFLIETVLNSSQITVLNNFYVYYRNIDITSTSFKRNKTYFYGLIDAYRDVCDLLEEFSIGFDVQEITIFKHINFFTTQVLRSQIAKSLDDAALKEIFNSDSFNDLANKEVFKNNPLFVEYFKNMNNGNYNNRPILNEIYNNLNQNLVKGNVGLKNDVERLNRLYDEISKENNTLIEEKNDLINEVNNLNDKNNEITQQNNNLTNELNDLTNKNNEITQQNTTLTNELNDLTNKNNEITQQNNNLTNELDDLTKKHNTMTRQNIDFKNELKDLNYEIDDLETNLNNLRTKYNTVKNENNDLNELKLKLNEDLIHLKNDVNYMKNMQTRMSDENKYLKVTNQNLLDENTDLQKIKSTKLWKLMNKFKGSK